MTTNRRSSGRPFDRFAADYDQALHRGLVLTGEQKSYYVQERVKWLAQRLGQVDFVPRRVLDYGCGTGSTAECLMRIPGVVEICGVDVSEASIALARQVHQVPGARFAVLDDYSPQSDVDLVYTNGVFHHIAPTNRASALRFIADTLRPGGLLAFWENNAWNPATRMVMRRIPFDRDAYLLAPPVARKLLGAAGFDVLRTDYLFIFPRWLSALRFLEAYLSSIPLGAQYLVLASKRDPAPNGHHP